MSDKLNLIETLAKEQKWSTFSRVLGKSGVNAWFSGDGDFTVFAPTNDAFAKIPETTMNDLLNEDNQIALKALLSYHILPNRLMAANLSSNPVGKAVTGEELTFTDTNGLKVNGTTVQARNILATNGVIHQIDTVLAPPVNGGAAKPTLLAEPVTTPLATNGAPPETSEVGDKGFTRSTTIL